MGPSTMGPERTHGLAAAGGSVRRHNLALALRVIADSPRPVSRAQIAVTTGMTRATAGSLVDELLAGGLVGETEGATPARVGRPPTGLVVRAQGAAGLGLEANVDYLAATVVDLVGSVRSHLVVPGDQRGRSPVETLAQLAALGARAVRGIDRVSGVAVAVPGLVDTSRGLVRRAPNLGWRDVRVLETLRRNRTLAQAGPLSVRNEADFAALGELRAGAPSPDFILVSGEIGIGAGIVSRGRLFGGARGWSGEIGHVMVRPDGDRCACGATGCLETVAGQEAIMRRAGLRVAGGTALGGSAATALLVDRAMSGDDPVLDALAAAGTALGLALAAVLNTLDTPVVVLGGGYGRLSPWLMPPLAAELASRVLWAGLEPPAIRPALMGTDAAVRGAAWSVTDAVADDPAAWMAVVAADEAAART